MIDVGRYDYYHITLIPKWEMNSYEVLGPEIPQDFLSFP
jgi:hypothetical protein